MLKIEWERCKDFLSEINIKSLPKGYLTCAHNTYYALYHAICALNIEFDLPAPQTHKGLLNRTYHNFIQTNILNNQDNKTIVRAEEIRQKSDYNGQYKPTKEELTENYQNVHSLINKIKAISYVHSQKEIIEKHLEKEFPNSTISIKESSALYTNRILSGAQFHLFIDKTERTYITDKQTKDISYCNGYFPKGLFHRAKEWKTISGKQAGYTPTRVLSLENKKKL